MKFVKFTEEEKQRANEVSLIDYLHSRGEKIKHVGSSYFVESLNGVSISGNKWYSHYEKKGGFAVGFLKEFYDLDYVSAVVELLGEENIESLKGVNNTNYSKSKFKQVSKELEQKNNKIDFEEVKKDFVLPKKARNNDKLYDYLCNKRFIDKDIVNLFIQKGSLFQSLEKNNVVFVGFDENNIASAGCVKGSYVSEKGTFTQTLTGSNNDYCLTHKTDSDVVCVFEAPIDMLSFMTILKGEALEYNHLALDGVSEKALLKFLEQNENVTEIRLCLDNDTGGFEAVERISDILKEHGYKNIKRMSPFTKDWNEELKDLNGVVPKPSVTHPKYEAYQQKVDRLLFFYKENLKITEESFSLKYSDFTKNYKNNCFEDNEDSLEIMANNIVVLLKKHLKHIGKNVDEEKILNVFKDNYRTYKDKGKINGKVTELNELMKDFNTFREKSTLAEDEKVAFIKNMMSIGDMCIRVNIELEMIHNKELEKDMEQKNVNFNNSQVNENAINFG